MSKKEASKPGNDRMLGCLDEWNFVNWRRRLVNDATLTFGVHGCLFKTGEFHVTAFPDTAGYDEAKDPGQFAKRRLDAQISAAVKEESMAVDTKAKMYPFLINLISVGSMDHMKTMAEEDFAAQRDARCPKMLLELIVKTHLVNMDSTDLGQRKLKAKQLRQRYVQGSYQSLHDYHDGLLEAESTSVAMKNGASKAGELAVDYFDGLNDSYDEFKQSIHAALQLSKKEFPVELSEVHTLALGHHARRPVARLPVERKGTKSTFATTKQDAAAAEGGQDEEPWKEQGPRRGANWRGNLCAICDSKYHLCARCPENPKVIAAKSAQK